MTPFKNKDGWYVNLHIIKEADDHHVTTEAGWSIGIDGKGKRLLEPGDVAVFYATSDGWGGMVKGMFVDGVEYISYQTKEQSDAAFKKWKDDLDRDRRERFDAHIREWIETKNGLRKPLRDRLNRFEADDGFENFWLDMGSYELFICAQADKLLTWVEDCGNDTPELQVTAIKFWGELPYEQQVQFDWYDDAHSGNTYGAMIYLAKCLALGLEV